MSIKKLSEADATWPSDQSMLKKRNVPIQLRQSGDSRQEPGLEGIAAEGSRILIDQRIRKGPYWHLSQEAVAGVTRYTTGFIIRAPTSNPKTAV